MTYCMVADRNPGDVEGATRRFHEVELAHTTLSDPTYRAYYDYEIGINM